MSLPSSATLDVTTLSDWRVGTGAGRPGAADSVVRRDADELPFIPAKTLTGVWRDAAETLAAALGDGWPDAVELLFGSEPSRGAAGRVRAPIPAALSVCAARMPAELRERLAGGDSAQRRLREALTFVKPAIAIDERSGRAMDDFLRFDELARAGASLHADFAVDIARLGDVAQPALALLYGAATFVERLGADRRRGAGRVSLAVDGAAREEIVELLSTVPPPAFAITTSAPTAAHVGVAPEGGGAWQRVGLTFTLSTPVLAGATAAGNIVRSLDHLPGAYVLGAVSEALGCEQVAAALRAGDLLVTPATLEVDGTRGRPVALCIHRRKDEEGSFVNLFAPSSDAGDAQTKQVRSGYLGGGAHPRLAKVASSISTHGTIDEEAQRPTSDIGGVFSYHAIAAGQRFAAELRVRGDRLGDGEQLATALDGRTVRMGSSKKDDYGAATMTADAVAGGRPVTEDACTAATIWLLSDLLAVDGSLRPDPSIDGLLATVGAALGVGARIADVDGPQALLRTRRLDSWHVGWQLPRETMIAIQAGGCAKLCFEPATTRSALAELELTGIGGRRGEGFGQVAFDAPVLAVSTPTIHEQPPEPDPAGANPSEPVALLRADDAAAGYAAVVEDAAWRAEIARLAALTAAGDDTRYTALGLDPSTRGKPRASQLSALRDAALRMDAEEDPLKSWLGGVCERPARRDLWPSGTLVDTDTKAPPPSVHRLCHELGYVWTVLHDDAGLLAPGSSMCLARNGAELRKAHERWALQALVDACVRAIVREREREGGSDERDGS